jgi:tetratricopeptide (TPR) repeat protein
LWDCLELQKYPEAFIKLWNDVVVDEWGWEPLSDIELWQHVPNAVKRLIPDPFQAPPFLVPPQDYKPIGRDQILQEVKKQLLAGESVALHGIPGVGKTTLALALAYDPELLKHFRDGILWVGLGQKATGDVVFTQLKTWGEEVGLSAKELAQLTDIRSLMIAVRRQIGTRRILLIADDAWTIEAAQNFEVGGPHCAHLISTRSPEIAFDFAASGVVEVPPLTDSESQNLLIKFLPDLEKNRLQQLAEAAGRLPLSLILMGRNLRLRRLEGAHEVEKFLEELRQRKVRLGLSRPVSPLKQSPSWQEQWVTLQAIIALSYDALDDAALKYTLEALSVFPPNPNSFSKEAALAVTGSSLDMLSTLVNQSGLVQTSGERFTLHQTITDFLTEQLSDETAYQQMAKFFADFVNTHRTDYDSIELEITNILEALQLADKQRMSALLIQGANALYHFLEIKGLYKLAKTHLSRAEQVTKDLADVNGRATTLFNLGHIAERHGEYERAQKHYQESLTLFKEIGNLDNISAVLQGLGVVADRQGDFERAKEYLQKALESARQTNNRKRISTILLNLGGIAHDTGDLTQAEEYLQESLAIARQIGYLENIGTLMVNLGAIAGSRGDYAQEQEFYEEGLAVARKLGYRVDMAYLLTNMGMLSEDIGDYDQAQAYYYEGLTIAQEIGHRERICALLRSLGWLTTLRGDYEQAETYFQRSLDIARRIEHPLSITKILNSLGETYLRQQKFDSAELTFSESLQIARKLGGEEFMADALYGIARLADFQGNLVEARHYGQESLVIFERIGHKKAAEVKQWLYTLSTN